MGQGLYIVLVVGLVVGALFLARFLARTRRWVWGVIFGAVLGLLALELQRPGIQWGIGVMFGPPGEWAALGEAILFVSLVLPVMIGYAIGLILGFLSRRADQDQT